MEEKRKQVRHTARMKLLISSLFHQDNVNVEKLDAPITIVDISKSGIGFHTESILPVGYYFNANLKLSDDDARLYCVVKIIRAKSLGNGITSYGCEFVGMAPVLEYIFDEYAKNHPAE